MTAAVLQQIPELFDVWLRYAKAVVRRPAMRRLSGGKLCRKTTVYNDAETHV